MQWKRDYGVVRCDRSQWFLMSIRLRRHLDWRWRCDRRSGEVSNHRGIVACERIVNQSENALMKYDQTFPIGLAALSGHLVVWSIRFATRRGWARNGVQIQQTLQLEDDKESEEVGYYRWAKMFVGWETQVGGREEFETLVWRVYWGEPGERSQPLGPTEILGFWIWTLGRLFFWDYLLSFFYGCFCFWSFSKMFSFFYIRI